jgi:hypothetical protein
MPYTTKHRLHRSSPLLALLVAGAGCGGGSAADAVRDGARGYYRALAAGDSAAVCRHSTARSRRSLAAAARLQLLAAGEAPESASRATCADVHIPAAGTLKVVAVRVRADVAWVRVKGSRRNIGAPFRRQSGAWRYDRAVAAGNPFPPVSPACVQSWNDPANATTQTQALPRAVYLPTAGRLEDLQQGGCRLHVRGTHEDATFESTPVTDWSETVDTGSAREKPRFNVRVFENGLLQPLAEVAAGAPPPQPPPPSPAPAPWQDCGRIRSPFDRRPLRVEARTFDCRAGRRVAVRFLRDGSLPYGWRPSDCAASRPACEQGGFGFRVVK